VLLLVVIGSSTAVFAPGGNSSPSRPRGQHALPVAEVIRELKSIIGAEDKATVALLDNAVGLSAIGTARKGLGRLVLGTAIGSVGHDDLNRAYDEDDLAAEGLLRILDSLDVADADPREVGIVLSHLRSARQFKEKALAALTAGEQPATGSVEVPFAWPPGTPVAEYFDFTVTVPGSVESVVADLQPVLRGLKGVWEISSRSTTPRLLKFEGVLFEPPGAAPLPNVIYLDYKIGFSGSGVLVIGPVVVMPFAPTTSAVVKNCQKLSPRARSHVWLAERLNGHAVTAGGLVAECRQELTGLKTAAPTTTPPATKQPPAAASDNLVSNGGAELGPTAGDDAATVPPQGWTTSGNFTAVKYGSTGSTGGLPDTAVSSSISGGVSMFAGGAKNASSSATQTVAVPDSWLKAVSAGQVTATVSADLGGWQDQPDAATVTYVFLDTSGTAVGSVKIGPVTPARRLSVTKFLSVTGTAPVPPTTRSVKITIAAIRGSGSYNDGYADNVSLKLGN
jgi:hypothetical protein